MKFLIITKDYPPMPSPSGLIASYLACALRKRGHSVDVITRDNGLSASEYFSKDNNINIVKSTFWDRLCIKVHSGNTDSILKTVYFILMFIRKLYLAFNIAKFPNSEPSVTRRIVKLFKKKLLKNEYDYVIGFFRPYSSLISAIEIKNRSNKTKGIAYFLDLVEPKDCPKLMPQSLFKKLIARGDRYVFQNNTTIILPLSAKGILNPLYKEYAEKIIYCEFPTFILDLHLQPDLVMQASGSIVMLFAGTLNSGFRNPLKLLHLINGVAAKLSEKAIILKFFGGGDCNDIINNYEHCSNLRIEQHGLVSKDIVNREMGKANFLINITNSYNAIVPSKIFELFASCKPIINVVNKDDDGSEKYFTRYPLCFTAKWNTDAEFDLVVESLYKFLIDNEKKRANIEQVKKIYHKCTPDYVVDQIIIRSIEAIKDEKNK